MVNRLFAKCKDHCLPSILSIFSLLQTNWTFTKRLQSQFTGNRCFQHPKCHATSYVSQRKAWLPFFLRCRPSTSTHVQVYLVLHPLVVADCQVCTLVVECNLDFSPWLDIRQITSRTCYNDAARHMCMLCTHCVICAQTTSHVQLLVLLWINLLWSCLFNMPFIKFTLKKKF